MAENVCWHCKVVLDPSPPPRCESCPAECDDADCVEEGCQAAHALGLAATGATVELDAEARGTPGAQRKAWEEGYIACLRDAVDALEPGPSLRRMRATPNPYPDTEKELND